MQDQEDDDKHVKWIIRLMLLFYLEECIIPFQIGEYKDTNIDLFINAL